MVFENEGFEGEIFLLLAAPLPTACGDRGGRLKVKNQKAKCKIKGVRSQKTGVRI